MLVCLQADSLVEGLYEFAIVDILSVVGLCVGDFLLCGIVQIVVQSIVEIVFLCEIALIVPHIDIIAGRLEYGKKIRMMIPRLVGAAVVARQYVAHGYAGSVRCAYDIVENKESSRVPFLAKQRSGGKGVTV